MASKPSSLPRWAAGVIANDPVSGQPNVIEPTSGMAESGYAYNDYPGRQFFNWLGRVVSQWSEWFDQQEQASTAAVAAHEITLTQHGEAIAATEGVANNAAQVNVLQDAKIAALQVEVDAFSAFVGMPIGVVIPYYGSPATLSALTSNWLICDGSIFNTTTYSELHAHLVAMSAVDASRTPKMNGRTVIGAGQYSDPLSSTIWNNTVGDTAGLAEVKLETPNLPPHTHTMNTADNTYDIGNGGADGRGIGGAATGSTGGHVPHENRQPYFVMNYIIKAK